MKLRKSFLIRFLGGSSESDEELEDEEEEEGDTRLDFLVFFVFLAGRGDFLDLDLVRLFEGGLPEDVPVGLSEFSASDEELEDEDDEDEIRLDSLVFSVLLAGGEDSLVFSVLLAGREDSLVFPVLLAGGEDSFVFSVFDLEMAGLFEEDLPEDVPEGLSGFAWDPCFFLGSSFPPFFLKLESSAGVKEGSSSILSWAPTSSLEEGGRAGGPLGSC